MKKSEPIGTAKNTNGGGKTHAERLADDLYRVRVPFDDLFTSVFVAVAEKKVYLVDIATVAADVDTHVLPALAELGFAPTDIGGVLLSHHHGDHAGGLPRLTELSGPLPVHSADDLSDGERVFGLFRAVSAPGHSPDSMAYVDERSGSMISGDSLQFLGVGRGYGTCACDADAYVETMRKFDALDLCNLFPSHDFVGGAASSIGRDAVKKALASNRACYAEIVDFCKECVRRSLTDAKQIADMYAKKHPSLPMIPSITFDALLSARSADLRPD